eukprot:scaffold361013_cov18-Prasinocladus_malaysianus.AAC.1
MANFRHRRPATLMLRLSTPCNDNGKWYPADAKYTDFLCEEWPAITRFLESHVTAVRGNP